MSQMTLKHLVLLTLSGPLMPSSKVKLSLCASAGSRVKEASATFFCADLERRIPERSSCAAVAGSVKRPRPSSSRGPIICPPVRVLGC